MSAAAQEPYIVALNLTKRCNLNCAHCYLDADILKQGDAGELSSDEVQQILNDIAALSPGCMVVLTGGEPLVRPDIEQLAAHAAGLGLMVVIGSNGVLLNAKRAARLKAAGVMGVGISLDSLDPDYHDEFRGRKGAWGKTMAAIDACRAEKLPYQIHFSVTDDNAHELDDMIGFARNAEAMALNLFFLVCTGRGEKVSNISAETYEKALRQITLRARDEHELIIRAKCAPHFKRMAIELDPDWAITTAQGYDAGGCLAGSRYFRITPEGDVTACPYMEQSAGSLRERSLADIWENAEIFQQMRAPKLEGRCGECEYGKLCGGCRARPLAKDGNLMGEDFLCGYQPRGGAVIEPLQEAGHDIVWTEDAQSRLEHIPAFVRRMVRLRADSHVRETGTNRVTADVLTSLANKRFGKADMPWSRPEAGGKNDG